MKEPDQ